MNARSPITLCLASVFALYLGSAAAQGSSVGGTSTPPPTPPAGAGDTAKSGGAGSATMSQDTTSGAKSTQKTKKKAKHKKSTSTHQTSGFVSEQDTPYHRALRSCVEGPADQRDSCLDDAIAKNSH
jgi:hypothetical protein